MWSLVKDDHQQIWVGSDGGLLRADIKNNRIWKPPEIQNHPGLAGADVRLLYHKENTLLLNTVKNGSFSMNTINMQISEDRKLG